MSRVRRIAKLSVLAGGTLSADRLEINRRKDGVLGLDTPGGSFLEQRYRGLTAPRAMKDVNIQARHDSSPVVEESICLARKEADAGNPLGAAKVTLIGNVARIPEPDLAEGRVRCARNGRARRFSKTPPLLPCLDVRQDTLPP